MMSTAVLFILECPQQDSSSTLSWVTNSMLGFKRTLKLHTQFFFNNIVLLIVIFKHTVLGCWLLLW